MKDNWNRMIAAGATSWQTDFITDVGFAVDASPLRKAVCAGPLLTSVIPASTSTCSGKEHCSTAIDDSVPFIEKGNGDKQYLYDINVWPSLVKHNKKC